MKSRWGILAILLVAAALRLWALPELPLGLHYDEAANVILTRQIADGGALPLFIRAYTGKEVLFFYAAAPWLRITGGAPWGLRLGAAMLGVLTVAATFATARALLGPGARSRRVALLAAGWLAIAFPHVLLSRYGFRAISQPLLQALTVAALWHGLRAGKPRWLLAAGLFLGLTGYTYLAARLFPIPLGLALVWLLVRSPREERPRRLRQLGLVGLVAALTFAPLGNYFLQNPDAFFTRIDQVAAPTWADAARGFWLCLRALGLPGAGEAYVRFNIPGRPLLDPFSALLAALGLGALLFRRGAQPLDRAAGALVALALPVMLLPSALATAEITPSNLRLSGLYPFLPLLPALGAAALLERLPRPRVGHGVALAGLLLVGGLTTGRAYLAWAASPALFHNADGELVRAAEALDAADLTHTTVYIASEHYRHPTVAALARQYPQAKWLTGGATLVLPPEGDALYLIPAALQPPAPWPERLTALWTTDMFPDPVGEPALWAYRLSAEAIARLRPAQPPAADFAHVVAAYAGEALTPCRAGAPCPTLTIWEVRAPYPALQPVVRVTHPQTGEWARVTTFHYPTAEWTVGELVWDQLAPVLPAGTPPVAGYEIGLRFFDPETGAVLPRLAADERFAGLEARFPLGTVQPAALPPDPAALVGACAASGAPVIAASGLRLLGWSALPLQAHPGEVLHLTLCWQAPIEPLSGISPRLALEGPVTVTLYDGAPAQGAYPFEQWAAQTLLEDRYSPRLPRTLPPGRYAARLYLGESPLAMLGAVDVLPLEREFALPAPQLPLEADFGGRVALLGADLGAAQPGAPFEVTLYWQALAEMVEEYTVFVHLLDPATGQIVAQVDAGPRAGSYPTSWWAVGEVVRDTCVLALPPELPPGTYTLRVGLYIQETGEHLQVAGEEGLRLPDIWVGP